MNSKYKIKTRIEMKDEVDAKILFNAISPENAEVINGKLESYIEGESLITEFKGEIRLSTFINTIDDILKTANLAKSVNNGKN